MLTDLNRASPPEISIEDISALGRRRAILLDSCDPFDSRLGTLLLVAAALLIFVAVAPSAAAGITE